MRPYWRVKMYKLSLLPATTQSNLNLLIVNPAGLDTAVWRETAQAQGMEVSETSSTAHALERVRLGQSHFIVLALPKHTDSAFDLCRQIRALRYGLYTYVVHWAPDVSEALHAEACVAQLDQIITHDAPKASLSTCVAEGLRTLHHQHILYTQELDLPTEQRLLENKLHHIRQQQESMQVKNQATVCGTRVHAYAWPYTIVSGDQYNVFELSEGVLAFFMIDVVGHGISSAIRAMGISRLFSPSPFESALFKPRQSMAETPVPRSPGEVLNAISQVCARSLDDLGFVCGMYGMLDTRSCALSLSVAGMPLPYLIRHTGEVCKLGTHDVPMGILDEPAYETVHTTVGPGDALMLYSDGLTDILNSSGQSITDDMLDHVVRSHAPQGFAALQDALRLQLMRWSNKPQNHILSDDLTVVGMDLFHSQANTRINSTAPSSKPERISVSLNNLAGFVRRVLLVFSEYTPSDNLFNTLHALGISHDLVRLEDLPTADEALFDDVDLVLLEATGNNSLTNRWLETLSQREQGQKPLVVACHRLPTLPDAQALLALGAHKIVRIPCGPNEIRFHLETCSRHIQYIGALDLKHDQLATLRREVKHDLERVSRRQKATLPPQNSPVCGLQARWLYRSATSLSGDMLGLAPATDDTTVFFALGGQGTGLLNGIKSWAISNAILGMSGETGKHHQMPDSLVGMKVIQPPSLLLTIVNHKVLESPHAHGMTFSLAYGVMNHRDGRTRLALAGSVPVILCRNNGDIQVFESDSAPVGQTAGTRYDDHEFVLQAGDRLLMLTHGLMRILNKTSPSVLNTLSGLMKLSTLEPLDAVYNTLQHWLDTLGISTDTEDLTLLLLERNAP